MNSLDVISIGQKPTNTAPSIGLYPSGIVFGRAQILMLRRSLGDDLAVTTEEAQCQVHRLGVCRTGVRQPVGGVDLSTDAFTRETDHPARKSLRPRNVGLLLSNVELGAPR